MGRKEKMFGTKILIFLFVAGMILVGYIWNSFVVDKRANEIMKLKKEVERLKMEKLFLEARYEKLTSANYVVQYSRHYLGLTFPKVSPKEILIKK